MIMVTIRSRRPESPRSRQSAEPLSVHGVQAAKSHIRSTPAQADLRLSGSGGASAAVAIPYGRSPGARALR